MLTVVGCYVGICISACMCTYYVPHQTNSRTDVRFAFWHQTFLRQVLSNFPYLLALQGRLFLFIFPLIEYPWLVQANPPKSSFRLRKEIFTQVQMIDHLRTSEGSPDNYSSNRILDFSPEISPDPDMLKKAACDARFVHSISWSQSLRTISFPAP